VTCSHYLALTVLSEILYTVKSWELSTTPTSFMICDILDWGRRNGSSKGDETSQSVVSRKKGAQVDELERRFAVQQYLKGQERNQLPSTIGLTKSHVKILFCNKRCKSKRQQTEHARLSPNGVLTNSPIFTDLKTPSPSFPIASIPVALSSPQALPTPTPQTPLYTLPGSDYFRYPPLVKPGLPTLPNSIQQDLCHPSLT